MAIKQLYSRTTPPRAVGGVVVRVYGRTACAHRAMTRIPHTCQFVQQHAHRTRSTRTHTLSLLSLSLFLSFYWGSQEAFEAELVLERDRSLWLEGQLSRTRQMLQSLSENVNQSMIEEAAGGGPRGTWQPGFMRNTKSAQRRQRTGGGHSRSTSSSWEGGAGGRRSSGIHKILTEANHVRAVLSAGGGCCSRRVASRQCQQHADAA
jgi:hypothetical protein